MDSGITRIFGFGAGPGKDLETAQAAVQNGDGGTRIIHSRGQCPGGNFGKHHQPKSGVLGKAAVMFDQYGILKALRIQ